MGVNITLTDEVILFGIWKHVGNTLPTGPFYVYCMCCFSTRARHSDMESTIRHVWGLASHLPRRNPVHDKMRSYLFNNALSVSQFRYRMDLGAMGPSIRCQHCLNEWEYQKYSCNRLQWKKLNKKTKRKYKLVAENIGGQQKDSTVLKAQNILYSKHVEVKCFICDKTTKFPTKARSQKPAMKMSVNITLNALDHSHTDSNLANGTVTPNRKVHVFQRNNVGQSSKKKKKLRELCYQTSSGLPTSSPSEVQNMPNFKINMLQNTPVLNAKKKKQRDKYAGLFKEACIGASTPQQKQTGDLQKFLKKT